MLALGYSGCLQKIIDKFLKTPTKKRCPFREFTGNSKKAPSKVCLPLSILGNRGLEAEYICLISMESFKFVLTFYPDLCNKIAT